MAERRRVRRLIGLAAALVLAGGIVAAGATPASAHANLIGTDPAHGTELDTPPEQVRLRFTEEVTIPPEGVTLRDSSGAVVDTGPARNAANDLTTVVLPVPADLAEGGYVVLFRVVSADSHPVSGAVSFGLGTAAGPLDEVDLSGEDPAVATVFAAARWTSYAGLALLAGGLAVFVLCWPGGWTHQRARRLVTVGWVASAVGGLAVLLLQGPYATGRPLAAMLDPELISATLDTSYGTYVLVRLALVAGAAVLVFGPRRQPEPWRPAAALTVGVALPATWVGTGHAATSDRALDAISEVAHLVAMSTWFGGLAMLVVCVLPPSVVLPADEVAAMLRRFSLLATGAVAVLVVSGVYVAWRRVGTLEALLGTPYGRLLALKLAAMGVLLWLGAISRSVVQRRYASQPVGPEPDTVASRSKRRQARDMRARAESARAQLRQSVRLEAGTAVVVLAVASVLVATPPGAVVTAAEALAAERPGPVLDEVTAGVDGTVQVLVDPAWVGENRVVVELVDPSQDAWDAPEVWGTFELAGAAEGVGPLEVETTRLAPGVFEATGVTLPVAGEWRLTVVVRTSEIDTTAVQVDVPVS